jgi:hypothetical protein
VLVIAPCKLPGDKNLISAAPATVPEAKSNKHEVTATISVASLALKDVLSIDYARKQRREPGWTRQSPAGR